MNIPNQITVARLGLTAVLLVVLAFLQQRPLTAEVLDDGILTLSRAVDNPTLAWVCFGLFIVAAGTDYVDGYLARKWGQVTAFGRIADPFADKVLTTGTLIMLLKFDQVTAILPHWAAVVILAREFLVTAIRGFAESRGIEFPADKLGKIKMVVQCIAIPALLGLLGGAPFHELCMVTVWLAVALTVVSGIGYCVKARHILFADGA